MKLLPMSSAPVPMFRSLLPAKVKLPAHCQGRLAVRVTEPPLVLYDSPTAGLDPITANTIVALIAKERDLRDTANLMVTHRYQDGEIMANFRYNPDSGQLVPVAHALGSNGLRTMFMVLEEGRLVFEGSQKELEASKDPYVARFVRH